MRDSVIKEIEEKRLIAIVRGVGAGHQSLRPCYRTRQRHPPRKVIIYTIYLCLREIGAPRVNQDFVCLQKNGYPKVNKIYLFAFGRREAEV